MESAIIAATAITTDMVVALVSILCFSQIFISNITHRSAPLS